MKKEVDKTDKVDKDVASVKYKNPNFAKYRKYIQESSPKVREQIYKLYQATEKKEAKEKAKQKLYGAAIRQEKYHSRVGKFTKGIEKSLGSKAVSKGIIRSDRVTVRIPTIEPAEYRTIYFKKQFAQDKRQLFFT